MVVVINEIEEEVSDYCETSDEEIELSDTDSILSELSDNEDFTLKSKLPIVAKLQTLNRLTKYERCRLLSTRTYQLTMGCPSTLTPTQLKGLKNYSKIAEMEIDLKVIPLKINRKLNNFLEFIQ